MTVLRTEMFLESVGFPTDDMTSVVYSCWLAARTGVTPWARHRNWRAPHPVRGSFFSGRTQVRNPMPARTFCGQVPAIVSLRTCAGNAPPLIPSIGRGDDHTWRSWEPLEVGGFFLVAFKRGWSIRRVIGGSLSHLRARDLEKSRLDLDAMKARARKRRADGNISNPTSLPWQI